MGIFILLGFFCTIHRVLVLGTFHMNMHAELKLKKRSKCIALEKQNLNGNSKGNEKGVPNNMWVIIFRPGFKQRHHFRVFVKTTH